jgi:hypothetical protein
VRVQLAHLRLAGCNEPQPVATGCRTAHRGEIQPCSAAYGECNPRLLSNATSVRGKSRVVMWGESRRRFRRVLGRDQGPDAAYRVPAVAADVAGSNCDLSNAGPGRMRHQVAGDRDVASLCDEEALLSQK